MTFPRQRDGRPASPEYSLVFPAYNPGPRLTRTLNDLDQFLNSTPSIWELVFVLDGCTDGSNDVLRNWQPSRGTARVLSYSPNRGKGYAVRQGLLAAQARYRIFTDIDLAYPFSDVLRVARELRNGAEVVIGSRAHPDSQLTIPSSLLGHTFRRGIQSRVFSSLVRWMLPLQLGDSQAGLKGFSVNVVQRIVPKMSCNGFGVDCELLTACVRLGLPIMEVPVSVRYDAEGSTTNLRSTLRMVRELWRVRKAWPAVVASIPLPMAAEYREAG
jgi:dolichyl-phosphate beta-glucosyltransferase